MIGPRCGATAAAAVLHWCGAARSVGVLGEPGRRDRLRRRRHADHLQHQYRRRCRVGRAAGVRPGADGVQLPRARRPDRRRSRLRHHLRGRPRAAGARLRDQRQGGVLRRQADHLRRHGAGLGLAVRPVSRFRRGQPGRLQRHRDRRLRPGAEEGQGLVRPGPRVRRLRPAVRRDLDDAVARHRPTNSAGRRRLTAASSTTTVRHSTASRRCGTPPGISRRTSTSRSSRPRVRTSWIRSPTTAPSCWSPTTSGGAPTRHRQDHRLAARRRHPGPRQPGRRTTSSTSRRARRAR